VQVSKVLTASDIAAGEVELEVFVTATPMVHGLGTLNQTAKALLPLRPVPSYGLVVTIDQLHTGVPSRPGELSVLGYRNHSVYLHEACKLRKIVTYVHLPATIS
jgi:hypothetical protein